MKVLNEENRLLKILLYFITDLVLRMLSQINYWACFWSIEIWCWTLKQTRLDPFLRNLPCFRSYRMLDYNRHNSFLFEIIKNYYYLALFLNYSNYLHVAFGYISHLAVRHGETKQFTGDEPSGQFSLI